jgi:hypothetical protein
MHLKIKKITTKNYVGGEEKEIGAAKFVDKMPRISILVEYLLLTVMFISR